MGVGLLGPYSGYGEDTADLMQLGLAMRIGSCGYRWKRRRSVRCFAYPYGQGNLAAYGVDPVVIICFNSDSASSSGYIFSSMMPSGIKVLL